MKITFIQQKAYKYMINDYCSRLNLSYYPVAFDGLIPFREI